MSEVTIQFSPKHPLHLACDVASTRYALGGALVEPHPTEEGKVICAATNSRILAVVVEDGTATESAVAPAACFKSKKGEHVEVEKNGQWQRVSRMRKEPVTTQVLSPIEGRFPRWRDVLPNADSGNYLAVSLNPQYLLDLANAIGRDPADTYHGKAAVTLLIPRHHLDDNECNNDGIVVIHDNGVGVLMPCEGDENTRGGMPSHHTARKQYRDFLASVQEKAKT